MITNTAIQRAKPGKTDQLESLMRQLIEQVSAHEPGCTIFQYVRDPNDDGSYLVIEQCEDQVAYEFHRSTDHLKAFLPQVMMCLEGPPVLAEYADVLPELRVNHGHAGSGPASLFHIGVVVEELAKAVARF